MIVLSADLTNCKIVNRTLALLASILLIIAAVLGVYTEEADAAAQTVTLKYGATEVYGHGSSYAGGRTTVKWVTHIDGVAVDLDYEPGVSRSYAYCVQPTIEAPDDGTFNVTVVDDDDTGKVSTMRKLIYYLPGSYGYAKVTKKRWFANKDTDASDYAIGHIALSWIHANYSEGSEVWDGIPAEMERKCKSIVEDLKNLPDPPGSFEVFWVKVSGKQDIFGAFYSTEYGTATITKASSNRSITNGNSNYSLSGAQYTLYDDEACTVVSKTRSGSNAIFTIKADGSSDTLELEAGNYYIKETKAPKGYVLDKSVHSIEVQKDKTTVYTVQDTPKSNQLGILVQKVDKETGLARPQGGASLAGAEYTVKYYAVNASEGMSETAMASAIASASPAKINGKDAVWVFRTDEGGKIDLSNPNKYLVPEKSADLFRNSEGKPALPMGIISVCETKAPEGYLIDGTVRYACIYESGTAEKLNTLKNFNGDKALKEQVIRGDISLSKAAEGRRRMSGIEFKFTSLTSGEQHILITDKNGFLCTAANWNSHKANTNNGESAEDGIWFNGYNDEKLGAKPNDSLGALPYDSYLIEEIRSEANEGYELISDEISISRAGFNLDLGTYDDAKEKEPSISTSVKDSVTGENSAVSSVNMLIIDSVEYKNLRPGKTYVVDGILMDKETEKHMLDDEGNEIRGSTEFYAESENGTVEVEFSFSGTNLNGKSGVAFETLRLNDEVVAEHCDINDEKQTVMIVSEPTQQPEPDPDPEPTPDPEPEPTPEPTEPPRISRPETGDNNIQLIYYLTIVMLSLEMLLLTVKHRNDRLN